MDVTYENDRNRRKLESERNQNKKVILPYIEAINSTPFFKQYELYGRAHPPYLTGKSPCIPDFSDRFLTS